MDMFYALAEPRRRKIVELIASSGQLSATEICDSFDVTAQAISQHLKVLLDSGLLLVERRAQRRIYSINAESMMDMEEWARRTLRMWNERFDALDKVLEEQKSKHAKKPK